MWLYMVLFCDQVEINSASSLLGAQTGVAADQRRKNKKSLKMLPVFEIFGSIFRKKTKHNNSVPLLLHNCYFYMWLFTQQTHNLAWEILQENI